MKIPMLRLLLIAGLVVSLTPVAARGVRIAGVGNVSCGEYLELRPSKDASQDAIFVSWIWGYLAGFNMETRQPTTRETPDQPSTLAFVDKHCRAYPLDHVINATIALVGELGGKRNPR